ncbi:MAG: hypothetical protein BGO01_03640 [Armatimonadetes bacterium 55-13]|nr:hypothetical protein [Armatimonadota bacterium]OJU63040.1 MAG: hypothetical protein BGO01_03640 [Armatimonadetes bacterium 55-13]
MFKLFIDGNEPRIKRDLMWLTITGHDWRPCEVSSTDDPLTSSDVWVDPYNRIGMLKPLPITDEWHYTHTGGYAKYNKSSLGAGSNWENTDNLSVGDVYLDSKGDISGETLTTPALADNQPLFFSFFTYNSGNDVFENVRLSWTNGVQLRIFSNSRVEVWKNGKFKEDYSIAGRVKDNEKQQANSTVDLIIIPYNKKELLVHSNQGAGFTHSFVELEDDTAITTGAVSINFPNGKGRFQVAKCGFKSSGYLLSRLMVFRNAPVATQTYDDSYVSEANGGTVTTPRLVVADSIGTTFAANGTADTCRLRVDMSGDGTSSPYFHWWAGGYLPEFTETDDAEREEILDYVRQVSVSVDQSGKAASLSFTFINAYEVPVVEVANQTNRPLALTWEQEGIEPVDVFRGRTEAPEWELHSTDEATTVTINAKDWYSSFDAYTFSDIIPLDGLRLDDAIEFLISIAGFSHLDWSEIPTFDDYELPISPKGAEGKWGVAVQVGDTIGDWVAKLINDYAGTYTFGWRPTNNGYVQFVVVENDNEQASKVQLFQTIPEAKTHLIDVLGMTEEDAFKKKHLYTVSTYKEHYLEPEANVINVTGEEPRTGRPIFVIYEDANSLDPELLPSERPDNWLGIPRKYGLVDPSVTNLDIGEKVAEILFKRLTPKRRIAEWSGYVLFDDEGVAIWRGDVVDIALLGKFRITSMSFDINKDFDPDDEVNANFYALYKARYTGEWIAESDIQPEEPEE